jgi:hypothetical protein
MSKRHGATLQIDIICLSARLICLDVKLTIKVSYAQDRKQTLLQSPSHSMFLSFPIHLLVSHVYLYVFNYCVINFNDNVNVLRKIRSTNKMKFLYICLCLYIFVSFSFSHFQLCVINIICNVVM